MLWTTTLPTVAGGIILIGVLSLIFPGFWDFLTLHDRPFDQDVD